MNRETDNRFRRIGNPTTRATAMAAACKFADPLRIQVVAFAGTTHNLPQKNTHLKTSGSRSQCRVVRLIAPKTIIHKRGMRAKVAKVRINRRNQVASA